jgi:peptide/nickel transport system permease protein
VELIFRDNTTKYSFLFLAMLVGLAVVGPYITPYQYDETQYSEDDRILRNEGPSLAHPLGTTSLGYDVLSRIIYGARPTVLTGALGGTIIITIGMSIGITAGYIGGRVDDILMRFTDFVYGVPLIPFAIVMLTLLGVGFFTSIIVIGLVLWRSNARVLRSQVLQIKERPFILAAKATGASTPRIILKHILPNVAPMAILFFALGVGYSIIIQASLSFLGVSSPFVPSWGIMLRNAYKSGLLATAWWWSLPPGFLISLTVLASFMFGRGYEKLTSERDEIVVEG